MTSIYLHTFGCKANQYDTEIVRQALEDAGATVVDDPAAAELAVVNSCTVTRTGEAKMRGLVRRLARVRPGVRTVVMGCAAAVDDGRLAALPGVERVVPGPDASRVLEALGLGSTTVNGVLRRFARGSRAWLKIQDGCDEHCTFCATTIARGANRSRPAGEILEEARLLAASCHEIVLTGVHIGAYGRDRGAMSLGQLVERLIAAVPRVRFRLSSVEATEVDDRLADLMIAEPRRLAPHLHAPLQSGSDRVLKRMGRHWYDAATYRARLERLAERLPVFGLGADVMVGFPGETDADFGRTLDVVGGLPFTYIHVFPYSERPGAAAARLGPPVGPAEVRRRADELRATVDGSARAYRARRQGSDADIVVMRHRGGWYEGITEDYLTVHVSTSAHTVPGRFDGFLGRNGRGLVAELVPA